MDAPRDGSGAGPLAPTARASTVVRPLGIDAAEITGGYWCERQRVNREVSIPLALARIDQAGNLDNLRMAAEPRAGAYRGPVFMDSDVYKVLEALAWEQGRRPSPQLAAAAEAISAVIRAAQADDGYLNSFVQVARDGADRYADLVMGHELYCYGHLLQAAVAAHRVAPDDNLWAVALLVADHVQAIFGPHGRLGGAVEGHPLIEMALVELYRETADAKHLDLAEHLVAARGRQTLRGYDRDPMYFSDRVPARDATTVEGHAVRALYFAAGVADVVTERGVDGDPALARAQRRQWEHMVRAKTYLTGGLGSRWDGEAFGDPFELPPDRAYCETCAAIASIQWSWRLLLATGEARYADLIDRTLYNVFIAGVSRGATNSSTSTPCRSVPTPNPATIATRAWVASPGTTWRAARPTSCGPCRRWLGGAIVVRARGAVRTDPPSASAPYRDAAAPTSIAPRDDDTSVDITAVPYGRWANRGPGAMRVWLPQREPSPPGSTSAGKVR